MILRGPALDRRSSAARRPQAGYFQANAEPQAEAVRIGPDGSGDMNPGVLEQRREQRREPRRSVQGAVMVRFADPKPFAIHGKLMDVSEGAFRMAHEFSLLQAGQMVEFSHGYAAGQARVVWNRIQGQRVETGFLVVAK